MTQPIVEDAPITVDPIPASKSRTIREARLWQIWTAILAAAPDILNVLVYLLTSDAKFYDAVSRWLPWPIRYAAMTAIITYAQRNITLRKGTVAPIIGTPIPTNTK